MAWVIAIVGIVAVLLGGLWFLQGTGLVVIDPIACVGECVPLEGPHLGWTVAGSATMLVGIGLLGFASRRFRYRR